jgi:type I restriction enzyme, R subunit
MEHLERHSGGNPESKASEMEHAIRKHCTVHLDEDPAFYKRLSDKLEKLIQDHRENWDALAQGYEALRREAEAGRIEAVEGLSREASTFYDYIVQRAFGDGKVPIEYRQRLKGIDSVHHRYLAQGDPYH